MEGPTHWVYLDDEGVPQGPWTTEQMTSWYKAGYFTIETKVLATGATVDKDSLKPESFKAVGEHKTPCNFVGDTVADADTAAEEGEPVESKEEDEEEVTKSTEEPAEPAEPKDKGKDGTEEAETLQEKEEPQKLKWIYKDESGEEQGPFELSSMIAWHAAGYFPPDTEVKAEGEDEYIALKDRSSNPFEGEPEAVVPTVKKKRKVKKKWYYIDDRGQQQGPFNNKQMQVWYRSGWFTVRDWKVRLEGEQVFTSLRSRSQQEAGFVKPEKVVEPVQVEADTKESEKAEEGKQQSTDASDKPAEAEVAKPDEPFKEPLWIYLDKDGKEQGPWTSPQMRNWYAQGFLNLQIRVRTSTETNFTAIGAKDCCFTRPAPEFLAKKALEEKNKVTPEQQAEAAKIQAQQQLQQKMAAEALAKAQVQQEQGSQARPNVAATGVSELTATLDKIDQVAMGGVNPQTVRASMQQPGIALKMMQQPNVTMSQQQMVGVPNPYSNPGYGMMPQMQGAGRGMGNPTYGMQMAPGVPGVPGMGRGMVMPPRPQHANPISGEMYKSTAAFNMGGKFQTVANGPAGPQSHWARKGLAEDRAGRQMSYFFDMDKWQDSQNARKEQRKAMGLPVKKPRVS